MFTGKGIFKKALALSIVFCVLFSGILCVEACKIKKQKVKEFVSLEIKDDGLNADFYYDKNAKKQKAIIVFGGSEGGKSWSTDYFEKYRLKLLNDGYAVLSLGYFAVEGRPANLESIEMEYFNKAINWVLKQPHIDRKGVGVIGYSKGGEASLLLASINPKVKAVVAAVPASNVFQCISGGYKSSWSYKGKDVPYAPFILNEVHAESLRKMIEEGKVEFVQVYKDAIANPEIAKMSAIKVEKSKAAILLLSGKTDVVWDSEGMCQNIIKRLKEKKYKRFYDHISYDTGHGVLDYDEAWEDILSFLKKQY